jgi:dynein heavy chain
MSLIYDLFPTIALDKAGHPQLEKIIDQQINEAGLVNHSSWTVKLVQVIHT